MTQMATVTDDPSATAIHMPMPRLTIRPPRKSDFNRLAYFRTAGGNGDELWADGKKVHGVVRIWGTSHGKLLPITEPVAWGPGQEGKSPQAAVADMLFAALRNHG